VNLYIYIYIYISSEQVGFKYYYDKIIDVSSAEARVNQIEMVPIVPPLGGSDVTLTLAGST
jgi:hypothetical protein